jgi:hypothetical protein
VCSCYEQAANANNILLKETEDTAMCCATQGVMRLVEKALGDYNPQVSGVPLLL